MQKQQHSKSHSKSHPKSSSIRLLLLEDVDGKGRKGDVVAARPGHARNFLLPEGFAVLVDKQTLMMQQRLKEEREKQAVIDRAIAQELANQINGLTLKTHVKVDQEGHMYGSVGAADIVNVLAREGITIERKFVRIGQPLKEVGLHVIKLGLKEGIVCSFKLKVVPEGMEDLPPAPAPEEAPAKE
jgi:large subunit ribosomal protein L9